MSFDSCIEYREYETINHKWYNVNHFVNELINTLEQEVIKIRQTVWYGL